jgi:hypothetical protein
MWRLGRPGSPQPEHPALYPLYGALRHQRAERRMRFLPGLPSDAPSRLCLGEWLPSTCPAAGARLRDWPLQRASLRSCKPTRRDPFIPIASHS